jgi:hypothetical protein
MFSAINLIYSVLERFVCPLEQQEISVLSIKPRKTAYKYKKNLPFNKNRQISMQNPDFSMQPLFIGGWEGLQSKTGSAKLAANFMQNPQNPMQFLYIRGLLRKIATERSTLGDAAFCNCKLHNAQPNPKRTHQPTPKTSHLHHTESRSSAIATPHNY